MTIPSTLIDAFNTFTEIVICLMIIATVHMNWEEFNFFYQIIALYAIFYQTYRAFNSLFSINK